MKSAPNSGEFSYMRGAVGQVDGAVGVVDTRKVTFRYFLGKDSRYGR